MKKQKFALLFSHRGIFSKNVVKQAIEDMKKAVIDSGNEYLIQPEGITPLNAVETAEQGRKYANFLKQHEGEFDGVILCLPNFGDENGAVAALKNCNVPILIQACPDIRGKMDIPNNRRDAFCGKFSMMDIFYQYHLPFTIFKHHTVSIISEEFNKELKDFAAICRVVNGMRDITVGAIGARVTAFKTVRFDEVALQKYGINTETIDLSDFFRRFEKFDIGRSDFNDKTQKLRNYANWGKTPEKSFNDLVKLSCIFDDYIRDFKLDCMAFRCWSELQEITKICGCIILSEFTDNLFPIACELDVCNAISMYALQLASSSPSTVLDWNNNWDNEDDKCILFHCGPVAKSLLIDKGEVVDHPMQIVSYGEGYGWGGVMGRMKPSPMTYASSKTEDGKLIFYVDEGRITDDKIDDNFFGTAGVAEISNLQNKIYRMGKKGFKHHVSLCYGHHADVIKEAFNTYLKYDIVDISK